MASLFGKGLKILERDGHCPIVSCEGCCAAQLCKQGPSVGVKPPALEKTKFSTQEQRSAYGEIFVMKYDGTEVEQLTDNQWEDGGPPRYGPRFREIKSLEEDNFLRFAGFRGYKCPVIGARGNGYDVSEVEDRRDRSNELYEQVAARG